MGVGRGQRLSLPAFPGGGDEAGQGYRPVRTWALGDTRFRIEPMGPRPAYLPGKPEATVLKNRYCHGKLKGPLLKAGRRGQRNISYQTSDAPSSGGYLETSYKIQPRSRAVWAKVACPWGDRRRCRFTGATVDLDLRPLSTPAPRL